MFLMFWFNEDIWGITYEMNDSWTDTSSKKTEAFTMLFNIFVFMNLFNMINCRQIKPTRRNVFKGLTNNLYFIFVFLFIAVI
jgi:magnesium-transporting ATPase (P-type)